MTYLAPHPWDAYGEPPPPGHPYQEPDTWTCEAVEGVDHDPPHTDRELCRQVLLAEAEEHDEEADRLRDDMWEAERARDDCERLADLVLPPKRVTPGQEAAL
jgi:hypothetical protein